MVIDRTRERSATGVEATIVAPVVEYGETSTIEAHTPIALISPQSLTPLVDCEAVKQRGSGTPPEFRDGATVRKMRRVFLALIDDGRTTD